MVNRASIIQETSVSLLRASLVQHFTTALGTHKSLENFVFTVTLADGTKGYGEAGIASHITGEKFNDAFVSLQNTGKELEGKDAADYLKISAGLHENLQFKKASLAAIEMALLDALTRQWKIPLWKFFDDTCVPVQTDITVVLGSLQESEDTVKKYFQQGFRAFKVKIGRDADLDFKRVGVVKKHAPGSRIFLDGNQGYSVKQTLDFLKALDEAQIKVDLLEQPVHRDDWEGLKEIARSTKVPVCADESVRSVSEAVRVIEEKAVSVINVKFMKFGLIHAREIAHLARANGVGLMMGGMLESSLAMTAAAHFAAAFKCFEYVDLDTPFFIKDDAAGNPCLNAQGIYDVSKVASGIGIIPSPVKKTQAWWGRLLSFLKR